MSRGAGSAGSGRETGPMFASPGAGWQCLAPTKDWEGCAQNEPLTGQAQGPSFQRLGDGVSIDLGGVLLQWTP